LIIVDDGITNGLQRRIGKSTIIEANYFFGRRDTDEGVSNTHGNNVFLSALSVSRAYDVIDLKVGSALSEFLENDLIEDALQDAIDTPDPPVGAINMSFGAPFFPSRYADEINLLAKRGILTVASAGNDGIRQAIEAPSFPAALGSVIAVGSHDGNGQPSAFSQNGPGVDILADGEDVPRQDVDGTSFAAPQVAATVTHVQAIVQGLTGERLGVAAMIDVLHVGGAGPLSLPDPADGRTRYFLHDHAASLDYAWTRYGGSPLLALEYIASHPDLIRDLGPNARAGQLHYENVGAVEQRTIGFDPLEYVASYVDLTRAFGLDPQSGALHYIANGFAEGRAADQFDALRYIASYGDLIRAFGTNERNGTLHYLANGFDEGRRPDRFDALDYIASHGDLIRAFGVNERSGTLHYVANGFGEGRTTSFDGLQYIASYGDLIRAFGVDERSGALHFIANGFFENRAPDQFDAAQYLANYVDLRRAFGDDEFAATQHFITNGFFENRTDDPLATTTDFIV
jgi:hypothetical protein